ncbi:MAG TPA: hypothetical protein PKD18_15535, partial [Saprospiraceae bacterium]|nr:hypothetical protein [Saprospiraceae bacterium]
MKNRITLFLTCLLCFNLFGQTPFKDLDIKQFQYADAQIRTFDLGLNQVSQFSYYDYGQDIQSTNNNFRFNGSFVTRQYKNSRKIQHSRALFGDFSTQKFNSGEESRPWAIRGNVGFNTQSRFYKENKFLEISPDFNLSIVKDDNLEFNGAVALKKGRGRIEPVSDVYMVRWMLKDLEDNGVNLSDWSQDDVFEIANRLNVINNYRKFDGRRQLKTQVKDISMAIESKGKGTL